VKGGQAGVEATEDVLYLSLSLRPIGSQHRTVDGTGGR
jgi:hypothetical protein